MTSSDTDTRNRVEAPLLSACLIVRDEEKNLPACFDSMDRLVPALAEVCVYDTGSIDGTVALCRDRGAKVVEGYWDGDFARARNEALAMTCATWTLIIDADEEVIAAPDVLVSVLTSREAGAVDVFNAPLTHVDEAGRPIGRSSYGALLRVSSVRYAGKIHEVAVRTDGRHTRTAEVDESVLTFRHSGYATAEIRRRKAERNAAAAAVDVEAAEAAGDRQRVGEARYHYARSLVRLGESAKAVEEFRRAWVCFQAGSVGRDRVAVHLVPTLLSLGLVADAIALVGDHNREAGAPALVRCLLARISLAAERPAEALESLSRVPPAGDPEHEVAPGDVLALRMEALDRLGRHDEALAACLLLVSEHGEVVRVGQLLARAAGQSPAALADLLQGATGKPWFLSLIEELGRGEGLGKEVARELGALVAGLPVHQSAPSDSLAL